MKIVERLHEAYALVDHWRREGLRIGLVPTMGALHEGHLSLVRTSHKDCDITVATIFVNPAQFGPHEDFSRYPRTLEADFELLTGAQADMVFVPQNDELYPPGFSTFIDPPAIASGLEGEFRPAHFRGVVTIVMKLFQILPATIAYFGQKDFQQLQVIRRMVEDLNVPIRVEGCETVRETDGLAMSSRNRYLSTEDRQAALGLWKALSRVQQMVAVGERSVEALETALRTTLLDSGIERIDYARVVDRENLSELQTLDRSAVALLAAHVGKTRLIDNLLLDPSYGSLEEPV